MTIEPAARAVILPNRPAGQATLIEQSRAAAEVFAAVSVAKQMPRDVQRAIHAMQQSCARPALAEVAFYRYPRAGEVVTGSTIKLAVELARCWGNIDYKVAELARRDSFTGAGAGESEMLAYAWDLETNTRASAIFIVPHMRDTKQGVKPLVDMRDVYENNANAGARRLRECIRRVLPGWFVEEAEELCRQTLTAEGRKSGKTVAQRAADAITAFQREFNIVQSQLEEKLGRTSGDWTELDLNLLLQVRKSLTNGETTRDEEFPPVRVSGEELAAQAIARARAAAVAPVAATSTVPAEPANSLIVFAPIARDSEPATDQPPGPGMLQVELWRCGRDGCDFAVRDADTGRERDERADQRLVAQASAAHMAEAHPDSSAAGFKGEQARRRAARHEPSPVIEVSEGDDGWPATTPPGGAGTAGHTSKQPVLDDEPDPRDE